MIFYHVLLLHGPTAQAMVVDNPQISLSPAAGWSNEALDPPQHTYHQSTSLGKLIAVKSMIFYHVLLLHGPTAQAMVVDNPQISLSPAAGWSNQALDPPQHTYHQSTS